MGDNSIKYNFSEVVQKAGQKALDLRQKQQASLAKRKIVLSIAVVVVGALAGVACTILTLQALGIIALPFLAAIGTIYVGIGAIGAGVLGLGLEAVALFLLIQTVVLCCKGDQDSMISYPPLSGDDNIIIKDMMSESDSEDLDVDDSEVDDNEPTRSEAEIRKMLRPPSCSSSVVHNDIVDSDDDRDDDFEVPLDSDDSYLHEAYVQQNKNNTSTNDKDITSSVSDDKSSYVDPDGEFPDEAFDFELADDTKKESVQLPKGDNIFEQATNALEPIGNTFKSPASDNNFPLSREELIDNTLSIFEWIGKAAKWFVDFNREMHPNPIRP